METIAGRLISAIHRKIYQRMQANLKDYDIDAGQFFFLRYLLQHQGIAQEEVAQNLFLDKATVSKGIKRLELLGYIRKEVNPADKRENHLFPTQKAIRIKDEIDEIYDEINQFLFHDLSDEEISLLENILGKILYKFDELNKNQINDRE